jgi:hypothetical protein
VVSFLQDIALMNLVNTFDVLVKFSRFVSALDQVVDGRFSIGGTFEGLEWQGVGREGKTDVEEGEKAHKEQDEGELGRHCDVLILELWKTERLSKGGKKRRWSVEEEEEEEEGGAFILPRAQEEDANTTTVKGRPQMGGDRWPGLDSVLMAGSGTEH